MTASSQSLSTCLIADDHPDFRKVLRDFLPEVTSQVWESENGAEAVATYEREHPDLVLMDISMPEMNGIEATREIVRRHPDAQVIIVTNFDDPTARDEATAAGAVGFICKSKLTDLIPVIGSLNDQDA